MSTKKAASTQEEKPARKRAVSKKTATTSKATPKAPEKVSEEQSLSNFIQDPVNRDRAINLAKDLRNMLGDGWVPIGKAIKKIYPHLRQSQYKEAAERTISSFQTLTLFELGLIDTNNGIVRVRIDLKKTHKLHLLKQELIEVQERQKSIEAELLRLEELGITP